MSQVAALRTPDTAFDVVKTAFPYAPHYVETLPGYHGLRVAYIDEGDHSDEQETFLCLHGEPSWSYLYRKMIPVFLASSKKARVVCPDFLGFGRSDKPTELETYTFDFHRQMLMEFIKFAKLKNVTLVCQDWGGVIGLTLPMEFEGLFNRLIVMNTALSTGKGKPTSGFLKWKAFCLKTPNLPVGGLIAKSVGTKKLTTEEIAAYDAPYPTGEYKAGVRTFPALVPVTPDMPGAATSAKAAKWWNTNSMPKFVCIGMLDPVLGHGPMMALLSHFKSGNVYVMKHSQAGHFVQEHGEEVAKAAIAFFNTPLLLSKL